MSDTQELDDTALRRWWTGLPAERRMALRNRGLVPFEWIVAEFAVPPERVEPTGPSDADRTRWAAYEAEHGEQTPESVKARAAELESSTDREEKRLRGLLLRVGYPIVCDRAGIPP